MLNHRPSITNQNFFYILYWLEEKGTLLTMDRILVFFLFHKKERTSSLYQDKAKKGTKEYSLWFEERRDSTDNKGRRKNISIACNIHQRWKKWWKRFWRNLRFDLSGQISNFIFLSSRCSDRLHSQCITRSCIIRIPCRIYFCIINTWFNDQWDRFIFGAFILWDTNLRPVAIEYSKVIVGR